MSSVLMWWKTKHSLFAILLEVNTCYWSHFCDFNSPLFLLCLIDLLINIVLAIFFVDNIHLDLSVFKGKYLGDWFNQLPVSVVATKIILRIAQEWFCSFILSSCKKCGELHNFLASYQTNWFVISDVNCTTFSQPPSDILRSGPCWNFSQTPRFLKELRSYSSPYFSPQFNTQEKHHSEPV